MKSGKDKYLGKFFKKADEVVQEGIKKADEAVQEGIKKADEAVQEGIKKADEAVQEGIKKADEAVQEGIKKADEVKDSALELKEIAAKQASKTGREIHEKAKVKGEALQKKGVETVDQTITSVKKMAAKPPPPPPPLNDLEILAKLEELRKLNVITDEEFETKKRDVLERI